MSKSLIQYSEHISYGDAVSDNAVFWYNYAQSCGLKTRLYVSRLKSEDTYNKKYCIPYPWDESLPSQNVLLFHFFMFTTIASKVALHEGGKFMVYHNLTPAEYFTPWDLGYSDQISSGRLQLKALSRHVDLAIGVSRYNCTELENWGYQNVTYCPLMISPDKWGILSDKEFERKLSDDRTNIVFVGRMAPHKRQDQCLKWFKEYLKNNNNARLIITGSLTSVPAYAGYVLELTQDLGLSNHVVFTGHINDSKMLAVMKAADLYLSFSEHEGFGVPLIEAMWFDVPVLAYAAAAVPETLGGAGMLFYDNQNFEDITLKVTSLLKDTSLRDMVLRKQKLRRADFLPESVGPYVDEILRKLACHV